MQTLLVKQTKVEMYLKKLRMGTQEEFEQVITIAKEAMEMAKRIYGETSQITNQTVLIYAMTLTKVEAR